MIRDRNLLSAYNSQTARDRHAVTIIHKQEIIYWESSDIIRFDLE